MAAAAAEGQEVIDLTADTDNDSVELTFEDLVRDGGKGKVDASNGQASAGAARNRAEMETTMPEFIALESDDEQRAQRGEPSNKRSKFMTARERFQLRREVQANALNNQSLTPWLRQGPYSRTRIIRLHQEIEDYYRYISPTPAENRMRDEVVARISEVANKLWPDAQVLLFGSFAAGLHLPTSDVDLVVLGEWPRLPLRPLSRALLKAGIAVDMQVIDKARVPIIKFRDRVTSLQVDVSFNMPGGPEDAQALKTHCRDYPGLKPLFLILKQFLLLRNLNEVFRGGLGSYGLFLMILSFVQVRPYKTTKASNLGVLLLEFLEHYGVNFNYENVGIGVRGDGELFPKLDRFDGSSDQRLCVENPRDTTLDVTWNSYRMFDIQYSFRHAFYVLSSMMATVRVPPYEHPSSLLGLLLCVPEDTQSYRAWVEDNFGDHADDNNSTSPAQRRS